MFCRQTKLLGKKVQEKINKTNILIAGIGGLGCISSEILARSGFNLILVDHDSFRKENMNRQLFCNKDTLGKNKATEAKKHLQKITNQKIVAEQKLIEKNNVDDLVSDANLVLDCLDNVKTRSILSKECKRQNKFLIHASCYSHKGQLTCFDKKYFHEIFNVKKIREKRCDTVLGPLPNILGSLQANEAIKYVSTKGDNIIAPKILFLDILKNKYKIKRI